MLAPFREPFGIVFEFCFALLQLSLSPCQVAAKTLKPLQQYFFIVLSSFKSFPTGCQLGQCRPFSLSGFPFGKEGFGFFVGLVVLQLNQFGQLFLGLCPAVGVVLQICKQSYFCIEAFPFRFCFRQGLLCILQMLFQFGALFVAEYEFLCSGQCALCAVGSGFLFVENAFDGCPVASEYLCVGQPFQYFGALFAVAAEEGGKLPLGKHGHSAELVEVHADGLFYHCAAVLADWGLVAHLECPLFSISHLLCDAESHACTVEYAVVALEPHFAIAFVFVGDADTRVLFDAVYAYLVAAGVVEDVSGLVGHAFYARCLSEQGHRYCIEQHGFSSAGVAVNEE